YIGWRGGGRQHSEQTKTSTAIPASTSVRATIDTTRRLSPPVNRREYVRRPGSLYTRSPHLARSIGARPIENGVRRTPQAPLAIRGGRGSTRHRRQVGRRGQAQQIHHRQLRR